MKKDDVSKSDVTRREILDAGVKLWPKVTARSVARSMGNTHAMIHYYYNAEELVDAVAAHAVDTGNSRVIAQLIATKHKAVRKLSPNERTKHLRAL